MNKDIRWQQRFKNYQKALKQLENAVAIAKERPLSNLEQQGLIQAFEYTHELAWKTLKDFLNEQGYQDIYGSKDTSRVAFNLEILENGEVWMDMIKSRNLSSHTYNEDTTEEMTQKIIDHYFDAFKNLEQQLKRHLN